MKYNKADRMLRPIRRIAVVIATVVGLCSCGASEPSASASEARAGAATPLPAAEAADPTFDGPFAAEYREAWRTSESEGIRAILADETISDREWAEFQESFRRCLADNGITLMSHETSGRFRADTGDLAADVARERIDSCSVETGEKWITILYHQQSVNPQNQPPVAMLNECLIRNEALPSDYTTEQHEADAPELAFPFTSEDAWETYERCTADYGYIKQ